MGEQPLNESPQDHVKSVLAVHKCFKLKELPLQKVFPTPRSLAPAASPCVQAPVFLGLKTNTNLAGLSLIKELHEIDRITM